MITAGKYSYGHQHIKVMHGKPGEVGVTLGSFCSVGPDVTVHLYSGHHTDWVTTYPFGHIHQDVFNKHSGVGHPVCKGPVTIGSDVWIGQAVTILSGVTIGDGAVIGCNTVVTKDVKPYQIVCGNPGKVVRSRFTEEQIVELLKIKWWNWEDEKINQATPLLCADSMDQFIQTYKVA